ncbi:Pycsar system effector family protein [Polaribacter gangjinensis]|uniref:Phosphohydrolase n=1 Tax=Polaribacter gangjinensis TaxID=574710 RepID=A0A2S7WDN3_9FLAO|nr:Pycsar system effector family protein [Polaribacter gangjinensis]PQJ75725.1 phosphohydrolase [Polaribacter gangjinensis]
MSTLLSEIENYVTTLLGTQLDAMYVYHNLAHTQRIVTVVKELVEASQLGENEAENVIIAAWFHDTGFVKGAKNHEEESVKIATDFLKEKGISEDQMATISAIILATKLGHQPKNELEKIIIDADCAHLASKNYEDFANLLRKEWELTSSKKLSDLEWTNQNIAFFAEQHRFYSTFALKEWTKNKSKNFAKLIKNQQELQESSLKFNQKQEVIKIKKNKGAVPERGVETMFRVALRNHITLSDIADTKANILLSVNAIIISMSFSTLIPKLDNPHNSFLIVPSVIFILFTVASMILSILATRPNVTQGKFSKEDVANKKVNLLFFGNFHQMKLEDFEWGISEMMHDKDYLYGSLTKDLYFLGLVLNRKYGLLRTTYTVFMIGIIVSVIAFGLAFVL